MDLTMLAILESQPVYTCQLCHEMYPTKFCGRCINTENFEMGFFWNRFGVLYPEGAMLEILMSTMESDVIEARRVR